LSHIRKKWEFQNASDYAQFKTQSRTVIFLIRFNYCFGDQTMGRSRLGAERSRNLRPCRGEKAARRNAEILPQGG
ncbi:MAG: hypothetical protein ABI977_20900, partial [Acidobacteriota bacterium]